MSYYPLRVRFGARIKAQAQGLSQEAFAYKCGLARSRIEWGGANPSLDAVEVLATALEVPVMALFDEVGG